MVVRGTRRATQWLAGAPVGNEVALAAATSVLDQVFAFGEDATIVRTRGRLWVASDQQVATEDASGAIGFSVVTDQAAAIGVTAVPKPVADQSSDNWFLWEPWATKFFFGSAVGFDAKGFSVIELDSKAQRKVDDGDNVAVVLQNNSSTAGIVFHLQFRMLVKLHG